MSHPQFPVMTVVVPTHGRVDLFLETLASLRRQTFEAFEVIVTDDSRRPEDRRAIEHATRDYIVATGRPAAYVFSGSALGQARNTNQGFRHAAGRLIRILHSDDLLAPRALEAEVALMDDPRLNLGLLHHLVEPFRAAPAFSRKPAFALVQPSLLFRSVLHSATPLPSALVFRRDVLDASGGGMREDFDFLCDWEFCARLVINEHRRNRFIGMVSPGFVGWRTHADSTTGRLWHKHFLEHEQFMAELGRNAELTEALIGDRATRERFFASAVRYRYRRLFEDVARMRPSQAVRSAGMILRCAFSPESLSEWVKRAPWSRWRRRDPDRLVVRDAAEASTAAAAKAADAKFVEPRKGWRFVLSAYASAVIIRRGKAYAARHAAGATAADVAPRHDGPAPISLGGRVEIRPFMDGPAPQPGTVQVLTEFNNTTNLWPVRRLVGGAREIALGSLNHNAFVEPVLHQCLKLVAPDAVVEMSIRDNQHLTAFGCKSVLEKLFPGQFRWIAQFKHGPIDHLLRYRRQAPGHRTYGAMHTGWTFGMLTTGTRLANVERFIDSIERQCHGPYEILLVSPVDLGALAERRHVRVLRFVEHDDLGWITKKKNLISAEAQYSDILICHDRFWLTDDFCRTFEDWGYGYGLAAVRVRLPDGSRGLDWAVVSSQNHVWSAGGLLDYRAYSQYAYNPGGATVIRKVFWQDYPWNENLFWNEHEDVELCRRVQRGGGIIALSAATLTAAEDRWVGENPRIPFCEQNEVLYGRPVGEQRIRFLSKRSAA